MQSPSRLCLFVAVALATQIVAGCDSNAASEQETKKSAQPAAGPNVDKDEKAVAQDTKKSHVESKAGGDKTSSSATDTTDPAAPAWFGKDLYPGSTVKKQGRSEPLATGGHSSMMLLTLADGATVETCVSTFKERLKDEFPELSEKPDGERVEVRGKNAAGLEAVLMCGAVDGKMTAYVSYSSP